MQQYKKEYSTNTPTIYKFDSKIVELIINLKLQVKKFEL